MGLPYLLDGCHVLFLVKTPNTYRLVFVFVAFNDVEEIVCVYVCVARKAAHWDGSDFLHDFVGGDCSKGRFCSPEF